MADDSDTDTLEDWAIESFEHIVSDDHVGLMPVRDKNGTKQALIVHVEGSEIYPLARLFRPEETPAADFIPYGEMTVIGSEEPSGPSGPEDR